jgi:hypothetical protein
MKSIDLENASYQAEGLKMLEDYKPELFLYNDKKEIVNLPANYGNTMPSSNKYDGLI